MEIIGAIEADAGVNGTLLNWMDDKVQGGGAVASIDVLAPVYERVVTGILEGGVETVQRNGLACATF